MVDDPRIIGGPTPIEAPRVGDIYRWKVQRGSAEQHVYVQIAESLRAEAVYPERQGRPLSFKFHLLLLRAASRR